ncbi:MAG: threonine--tRNA ligase [Alphaproteobacteria bacterium]
MSSIKITFPDLAVKEFNININGFEIAKSISSSLAKTALAIKINGELFDLSHKLNSDAKIEIITPKSGAEALEIIRHDCAHIMAEAVKELYPETQVTIGPAIENGFYYDFARQEPFTSEDLLVIENKMREIVKRDEKIVREEWNRDDAVDFFKKIKEDYKAEIIASIPADQQISLYRQGEFIDLCRGPHAPSTSHIKYFKLMKVAGAYWRGDSNNQMLQRIYGTAFESEESLKNYLFMLEEAEKRDHRKLGKQLDLFHIQEEATGSVFWHHKGYILYREIENYIRQKITDNGYVEVKTPQLIDKILWEKSGHWDKFRDNMFVAESENRLLAVKPMNCPGHVQIFNQSLKSYRQLPLRMAEFGCCHRNESSGSLHGIMRVRSFTQDDAHIFCEEHQINDETVKFCELLKSVYRDFGFEDILVKFSTRPEKRAGLDEVWDKAEQALEQAVNYAGLKYELNPGEGAFYGPKLEFTLVDALKRQWQCGTLQVDFVLPERLDVNYIAQDGSKKRPVMLHRAILGSLERFIGILIENFAGKLPLWLSPTQIVIAPITNEFDEYAVKINNILLQHKIRSECDLDSQKISYKIRQHSLNKVPYIIVVGKKEFEENKITVRELGSEKQVSYEIEEFLNLINKKIINKEINYQL